MPQLFRSKRYLEICGTITGVVNIGGSRHGIAIRAVWRGLVLTKGG